MPSTGGRRETRPAGSSTGGSRTHSHIEKEVAAGRIRAYGISSNTFVVPHDQYDAVSLARVLEHGGKGLKVIQLPLNPIETGAMQGIHTPEGKSVLDVASAAGLGVLVNRPFNAFGNRGSSGSPRSTGRSAQADVRRGIEPGEALKKARVKEMENYLTGRFGDVGAGTVLQNTGSGSCCGRKG